MKLPNFSQKEIITASVLLVAISIFYHFVIQPVYTKYQLSNCLQKVDENYKIIETKDCEDNKPMRLKSCLLDAQRKIYCSNPDNLEPSNYLSGGNGFLRSISYCPPNVGSRPTSSFEPLNFVPDNSDGYWNGNIEYQQLAGKCEEQVADISCDFSSIEIDHSMKQIKQARDECFKIY
jgi:hypothetical protein